MSKIYLCPGCGLMQVQQEGMLCPFCAVQQSPVSDAGDSWTGSAYQTRGNVGNHWAGGANQTRGGAGGNWAGAGDGRGEEAIAPDWSGRGCKPTPRPGVGIPEEPEPIGVCDRTSTPALQTGRNEYRGIVRAVQVHPEAGRRPGFLRRWTEALFSPTPFSMKPLQLTLQLSMNASDAMRRDNIGTAKIVRMYVDTNGEASYIAPGNRITVRGRADRSGVVQASAIFDETTGTMISGGISPMAVRAITLVLMFALLVLVCGATEGFGSMFGGVNVMQNLEDRLAEIIALLIVGGVLLGAIRRNPRLRKLCAWIVAIVALSLVCPPLAMIAIMAFGLRMLLGM